MTDRFPEPSATPAAIEVQHLTKSYGRVISHSRCRAARSAGSRAQRRRQDDHDADFDGAGALAERHGSHARRARRVDARNLQARRVRARDQGPVSVRAGRGDDPDDARLRVERLGSLDDLDARIEQVQKANPANLLAYLPLMYYRSVLHGEGKLDVLMNDRYTAIQPTTVRDYVAREGL